MRIPVFLPILVMVAASAVAAEPARAQSRPPDASSATARAVAALAWLEGAWEGEAWYGAAPESRDTILMSERVERRLDGQVLVVEGIGREPTADGSAGHVVHHALGVLSYDPDQERYTFRAYKEGRSIDPQTALEDGVFTWSFEAPGQGRIRYRIRQVDGEWRETGEFSRDGAVWHPFFEMTLHRAAIQSGDR